MGSPRTVEGRARNYGYQELLSDGRLGPQIGCHKRHNFYTLTPNPKQSSTATAENVRECCATLARRSLTIRNCEKHI